ncbi:MAG TPA: D-Ala-D-Ala carboxypeptidase family metallohydrolase [Chroococcidiopsis sp.]
MVQQILKVTQDTVFKLRPEPASQLTPREKYEAAAGTTYEIQSYAYADINGPFDGHIKFTLKASNIQGFNTWFIYSLHAKVEFDGRVVYPHEDQETLPILQINADTILKRRPIQSAALPPAETVAIQHGQKFLLHSYAYADAQGDFASHIKFAIRNQQDYVQGLSTWFVYDQHAYVEFDDQVVYPTEDPNLFVLRVTRETLFKRRPVQSSQLAPDEIYTVPPDTLLKLDSYAYADAQGSFNGHIKFALKYAKDYIRDLSTWYVYDQHAQVLRSGKVVYPVPKPSPSPSPVYSGRAFKLPGNTSTFYTDQPIVPGGSFTWGEATKNATRLPATVEIVNNIVALAKELQKVRNQIGRPLQVNSWYRPPAVNSAVGGVSNSQHLTGKAVDLQVSGYSGRQLANAVMLWWNGGVGIYSNLPNLLHLDIGPKRTWGF